MPVALDRNPKPSLNETQEAYLSLGRANLVISCFAVHLGALSNATNNMKLLLDFFPVVAFFIAYRVADIYVATATIMVAMPIQIFIQWLWTRTVSRMMLLSGLLVLIFGSVTLWLRDGIFIKWKPTVAYLLLAAGFLGTQLLTRTTPMERIMSETVTLENAIWKRINLMWVSVFVFLAFANLFVVYNFSESTWVNFKLFGILGITLLAVIAQVIWIARHTSLDNDSQ